MTVGTENADRTRHPAAPTLSDPLGSPAHPGASARGWIILLVVWALAAAYSYAYLMRGWVPHDEGSLALSAQRVLQGELPHRDFDELYTGALTYVNAAAFRVLGARLSSLRWPLFAVFLAWVPAFYAIARRFAGALAAGALTLLAVAWSLPNYSAAMPSWYNLFLATFGVWLALRYLETGSARWLFAAGVCAGASFAIKVSGLFFVAAMLLFFAFREQVQSRSAASAPTRATAYVGTQLVALLIFVALVAGVLRTYDSTYIFLFVLPSVAAAVFVAAGELRPGQASSRQRFRHLAAMVVPFLAGFVLPVLLLLVPFVRAGALSAWMNGVFVAPFRRVDFAALSPTHLGLADLLGLSLLLALVAAGLFWRRVPRIAAALIALTLLAFPIAARHSTAIYTSLWDSAARLIPVAAVLGCLALARQRTRQEELLQAQKTFLLLSTVAVCSLIQFPNAGAIYFCYVAPLLILAVAALLPRPRSTLIFAPLIGMYLLFAVLDVTPGFIYVMGQHFAPDEQTYRLNLPRAGGLRVSPELGQEYESLVALIQQHAGGDYIYAGPDCPQIYFLAGRRNPTRTLFDFFDDPATHDEVVQQAIESRGVRLVVLAREPEFSDPISSQLMEWFTRQFPHSQEMDDFEVRWRE